MMIAAMIIVSILSMLLGFAGCIVWLLISIGIERDDHKKYHVPNTISSHASPTSPYYDTQIRAINRNLIEYEKRIVSLEIDVHNIFDVLEDVTDKIANEEDCDDGK